MFKRKAPQKQQMRVELNDALKDAVKLCRIKAKLKKIKRAKR